MTKLYAMIIGWLFILSFACGACVGKDKVTPPQRIVTVTPTWPSERTPRPDAEVKPGSYGRANHLGSAPDPIAPNVAYVYIDRENRQATFKLADGSEVEASLGDVYWGRGCPDMFGSVDMEAVRLQGDELVLDGVTFQQPMLVATCPAPPTVIVLREWTTGGGPDILSAGACEWWAGAKCIYFAQEYAMLQGQIVDADGGEPIPDAEITFSSLAGEQSFAGTYLLSLPGGSVVDFAVRAPGFQSCNGQIETSSNVIGFVYETGVYAGERKLIQIADLNAPIEWDFPLAPESAP